MKLAIGLMVVSILSQLFGYLFAVPAHIMDPSWPDHARFHTLQAVFWLIGLAGISLALIWWPFRRKELWSIGALLFAVVCSQVGYFLAIAAIPEGAPPLVGSNTLLALILVMYLVGVGLGWREMKKSPPPQKS